MTEQEMNKLLNSLNEINEKLGKLDKLSELEKMNDSLVKMNKNKMESYKGLFEMPALGTSFVSLALLVLSTIIGIWGLNFQWFAGIAFGIVFTGVIIAFYEKYQF